MSIELEYTLYIILGKIKAFIGYIKTNRVLIDALIELNYTKFAFNYSSESYKDNNYDKRMQKEFEKLNNK